MKQESGIKFPETKNEKLKFDITITVYRHSSREEFVANAGLSPEGKEIAEDFFFYARSNPALRKEANIATSPVKRAKDTGEILKSAIEEEGIRMGETKEDSRLSEGNFSKEVFERLGYFKVKSSLLAWVEEERDLEEEKEKGFKTGKEAAAGFCAWLLETIENGKEKGGKSDTETISHAPVMAAFVYLLERKTGKKILSDIDPEWFMEKGREYNGMPKFENWYVRFFHDLQNFVFHIDSNNPEMLNFQFQGKNVDIPTDTIRDLAKINA